MNYIEFMTAVFLIDGELYRTMTTVYGIWPFDKSA
jgi:hypothetical protein